MPEYLKIPEERLKILLADDKLIKQIEQATQTRIHVDRDLNEIEVVETDSMRDPLSLWAARDVIKAIGRGFSAEDALELLSDENELRIVELTEYTGKNKNAQIRLKGRVIGREGKAKSFIEEQTDCRMEVYGKTVALIGPHDSVPIAAQAVEMLASGAMHGPVYHIVENEVKKLHTESLH